MLNIQPRDSVQTHFPATHDVPLPQNVPQVPQFDESDARSLQPSEQALYPGGQVQFPAMQGTPVEQMLPQKPQLFRSFTVSTQVVPQSAPPGQGSEMQAQLLKSTICPSGQATQVSPQSSVPLGQEQFPDAGSLHTDPTGQQTAPQTSNPFGQMQVQLPGSTINGSVQVRSQGVAVEFPDAPPPDDAVDWDCA